MPAEIVDGNDVLAVYEATRRAVAHARAGLGPYLLECKTFRMTGHSAHDAAHYVPKDLFEEWGKLDPIVRLEAQCSTKAGPTQAEIDDVHAGVREEVDDAVAWAEQSPYPDPADAARRRLREPLAMSTTYLEAIREGLWEEMERDPNVFLHRRRHRRLRRRVQGDRRLPRALRRAPRGGYAHLRSGHRGRGDRRGAHGAAAGGGDAVRRLHLLRLRPDRQLRRQVPLPLGRRRADRDPRALRRRHPRRPVPLAESRDVVRPHARPEGGRARPPPTTPRG